MPCAIQLALAFFGARFALVFLGAAFLAGAFLATAFFLVGAFFTAVFFAAVLRLVGALALLLAAFFFFAAGLLADLRRATAFSTMDAALSAAWARRDSSARSAWMGTSFSKEA
ncbi:MAG TPA: hypothetical protein DD808_18830 [Halieaceae bacterium]|nr:hypothetical protein [Haliea sp.]HBQ42598.1 hypothetical protein [Halieaceae bacterium]MAY92438.1 hypothetical protein [Haliea sp.]MBK40934.1 hypothetical protein [Haliea sp.]MBP68491.1 hypothetical protein [Haliea sp.]